MEKAKILALLLSFLLTSCYEKYTMDYEHTAAYVAYQYDLLTFVIGEGMKFNFTVALGGVVKNTHDRSVQVVIDDALLTDDLSGFSEKATAPFTALDGLLGRAPFGNLSQSYVSKEVAAQNLEKLTPLPADCYTTSSMDNLFIPKGRHTTTVTIKATDKILTKEEALKPYYALAFKVTDADADILISEKSFEIIAVKCEQRFWGNWYHGGETIVKNDITGEIVSRESYPLTLPQDDDKIYTLTTIAANAVESDKIGLGNGKLKLIFEDDDQIRIESADGSKPIRPITDKPSHFNGAKLLQDRKLYLNYQYSNGDGTTTYINDILVFRNRIRDGINEWQDENPEDYQ